METLSAEWSRTNAKMYSSAELPLGTLGDSSESLRLALEREYDEKLKAAKGVYEQRLSTITEHSRRFLEEAKTDEVIKTMRESHVSEQFAVHRMKELHDEEMAKEREETIDRLTKELMQQKGESAKWIQELQSVTAALRTAEDCLRLERNKSEELKTQLQRSGAALEEKRRRETELSKRSDEAQFERLNAKRAQDQIQRLEAQVRNTSDQLTTAMRDLEAEKQRNQQLEQEVSDVSENFEDMRRRTAEQSHNFAEMQKQLQRSKKEVEQLAEALNHADTEKSSIHEQLSQYDRDVKEALDAEDKARKEAFDTLKKRFKAKSRLFKKKITDQKAMIETMAGQVRTAETTLEQQQRDSEYRALSTQEDLRRVRDEWERRCQEVQLEAKRREAELTAKQQLQVNSLKSQYQQLVDQKINEMQADLDVQATRTRTQDGELRRTMEQRIQDLEREHKLQLDQLIRDQQLLNQQEQELRLRTQREKSSLEIAALQQELEKSKNELEAGKIGVQTRKQEVSDLRRKLEESEHTQQTLVQRLEEASDSLASIRQARDTEHRKVIQSEEEMRKLASESNEKDKQISRLARELTNWQEVCARLELDQKTLQVDLDTIHLHEKEREDRDRDLNNKCQESIAQVGRLQAEVSEYERRLGDVRQTLRSSDQEVVSLKQQLLDSHMNATETMKREALTIQEIQNKGRTALHQVLQYTQSLRSEFSALKLHIESDFHLHNKDLSSDFQTLLYEVMDYRRALLRENDLHVREVVTATQAEYADKVREVESELSMQTNSTISTFQEKIMSQEKHLEALRTAAQQLKKDNRVAQEEIEQLRVNNQTLRSENDQLTLKLKENSKAFDELQHEVQLEATRLKSESDTLRRELSKKTDEVLSLQRLIDDTRRRSAEDVRGTQDEVRKLRDQQSGELTELKRKYERVVDQVTLERDGEKEKGAKLRSQFKDLRVKVEELQTNSEKIVKNLEDQVKTMERTFRSEEERLVKAKLEKASDIDSLSQRLLQVTEELRDKERVCADLQKDRRTLTEQVQDQDKQLQILMQELADMRSSKDREIDSLKGLVSRSYTESMDQVRKARELDRETKELAAQIRKPPVRKAADPPERGTAK